MLTIIDPKFIDFAWRDGASSLCEATKVAEEVTGDQLKMILARGERILLRMESGGKTVGWCVIRIDQLPNMRVLHITDLVAHNAAFESYFGELAEMAKAMGCSRVRCSAPPAQARLYKHKVGFQPVYETLEIKL